MLKRLAILGATALAVAMPVTACAHAQAQAAPDPAEHTANAVDETLAWVEPMARLAPLIGEWSIQTEAMTPEGWVVVDTDPGSTTHEVNGAVVREISIFPLSGQRITLETSFGWDQFRGVYRMAVFDDQSGLPDIYEGDIDDANRLVVSNVRANTPWVNLEDGQAFHFRLTWELEAGERLLLVDISADGGATWNPIYRMTYTAVE